jgi:hypothetical protein
MNVTTLHMGVAGSFMEWKAEFQMICWNEGESDPYTVYFNMYFELQYFRLSE